MKLDEYGETEMEVDFYWVNDFNVVLQIKRALDLQIILVGK